MYTPFKMKGKSPMMKALIGKQNNLPQELKAKIMAAPESPAMMKKAPTKMKKKSSMKMMDKKSPAKKSIRQQQIEGTYVSPKDRPKKVVVKKPKKVSVRKQQILDAEKKRLSNRKGDNKYKENVEKVLKSQNRTLTPKKKEKVEVKKVEVKTTTPKITKANPPSEKSRNDIKKEKRLARNERRKAKVKDLRYRLLGKAGRAKMEAKGYVPKKKKK